MPNDVFDLFKNKVLNKLREIKEAKTWNAAEIADKSGLAVQTIYSLAGGQRGSEPEYSTIFKLAEALGWTMGDIAAELFPDQVGRVYQLVKDKPTMFNNMLVVMTSGDAADIKKLEADLEYMAKKVSPS
ncbi:MAG: helix-turn-helix transcriptional regulator [Desulfovibrionaceae bacterium]